ncbi:hypothetical protein [Aliamphritea hakodatensis]|uniref:hypothetical protein n=1 Tax=Aliamphritea hakodatensis TaxID=2895352 RepID=UPI0022FD62C0|nr:hypothetical protein [Aliamphritea hakodatensis]
MIKQRFYNFLMAALAVAGSAAVYAADSAEEKCQQLYTDGRYASAYTACKPLADDGGAIASFVMSNLYARGLGGASADVSQALTWLKIAAEADYGPACYNLAALYESGEVVEQSLPDAFNWYLRGAEAGHTESQLKAGVMLLKGDGVTANYQQAQDWLEKSAIGGDPNAQVTLAILQATAGDKQALHWYQQAAEQNNAFALYQLADIYAEGRLGEQVDLAKALRLSRQSLSLGRLSSKRLVEEIEERLAETRSVVAEPGSVGGTSSAQAAPDLVTAGLLAPDIKQPVKKLQPAVVKPESKPAEKPAVKPVKIEKTPASEVVVQLRKPKADKAARVNVAGEKTVAANFRDKAWLMQQPDQHIVMQLAQITDKAAVGRYIEKYDLQNQVDYYRARTRAGLVYVLLYHRNYETVTRSKEIARQVLAEGVQKGVWYRRFSTLQADYVAPDGES